MLISSENIDGFEITLVFLKLGIVLLLLIGNEPFPMILTKVRIEEGVVFISPFM